MDDETADEALEPADEDGARRARSDAPGEVGGGRRRTVTGALMAGIAMGFRDAFRPEPHDRTAIEQPAPEQPLEPQKYEIHLDPVAPESSFAIYRPWIDGDDPEGGTADATDTTDTTAGPPPPAVSDAVRPAKGGGAGALGG